MSSPLASGKNDSVPIMQNPHPAKAPGEASEHKATIPEDFARIMFSIAVFVFENDYAIAQFGLVRTTAVCVVLCHPQATTVIEVHADRLLHIGIAGYKVALKPAGNSISLTISSAAVDVALRPLC